MRLIHSILLLGWCITAQAISVCDTVRLVATTDYQRTNGVPVHHQPANDLKTRYQEGTEAVVQEITSNERWFRVTIGDDGGWIRRTDQSG